ncbi:hypothetical protein JZO77_23980, partial [Enterococcus hulanensis]|nr:hypothetical protein [Enterococcus hulanensis]
MKSDEKQRLLTKENLPIESIGQQDLHTAKTTLEQLQSWINVLELFDQFFNCKQSPLNKEKII